MNDGGRSLALVLEAIYKIDKDYAEYRKEYRDAREKLLNEVKRLGTDILTGQMSLVTEPTEQAGD